MVPPSLVQLLDQLRALQVLWAVEQHHNRAGVRARVTTALLHGAQWARTAALVESNEAVAEEWRLLSVRLSAAEAAYSILS